MIAHSRRIAAVAAALVFNGSGLTAQDRSQSRSTVASTGGIVASESVLASEVGARVLESGGNAVDAAVATNAMMGLIAPMNDGIGGGLACGRIAKSHATIGARGDDEPSVRTERQRMQRTVAIVELPQHPARVHAPDADRPV